MKQPKTSEEVGEMLLTGKVIDAAVRRAVRKAIGKPTRKPKAKPTNRRRPKAA